MLAKIIAWGETREAARRKMAYALKHTEVIGLISNIDWLAGVVESPVFAEGHYDTQFVQHYAYKTTRDPGTETAYAIAVAMFEWLAREKRRRKCWASRPTSSPRSRRGGTKTGIT